MAPPKSSRCKKVTIGAVVLLVVGGIITGLVVYFTDGGTKIIYGNLKSRNGRKMIKIWRFQE